MLPLPSHGLSMALRLIQASSVQGKMLAFACVCVCACMFAYVCACVCMFACAFVHAGMCVFAVHVVHVCVHVRICMCMLCLLVSGMCLPEIDQTDIRIGMPMENNAYWYQHIRFSTTNKPAPWPNENFKN